MCKSGIVSLWSPGSCDFGWSGIRSLPLDSQKISVGTSPLQPVTGLYYVSHEDALMISLFDGSIYLVHNLSSEPTLVPDGDSFTSHNISEATRAAVIRSELGRIGSSDVNRITGLVPYGHATVLWAHEYAWCLPVSDVYSCFFSHPGHASLQISDIIMIPSVIICS